MAGIPIGNGIEINYPLGPDHKFNVGGASSTYATKDGATGIPDYFRYEGMPVWAKEDGVWNKYILSADLVTWIPDIGGLTEAEVIAIADSAVFTHTQLENPHGTTAEDINAEGFGTVLQGLQDLRSTADGAASSISDHLLDKNDPHEITASQVETDDVNNSVQDYIDDFLADIAAKANQSDFTAHEASANPHANLLAANVKTEDTGVSVQSALNTVEAAVAAINTLDKLTGSAAEIASGDINVKKAIYYTPGADLTQQTTIPFTNKNIMRLNVTGDLTVNLAAGKATGQYWLILKFTANATVTFGATCTGLNPITGFAGSTIFLQGLYYDSKFHLIKSQVFDFTLTYYYGTSPDAAVLEAEVLATTARTDNSPDKLSIPFNMTEYAYPWLVAPIIFPYMYKKEAIGGYYLITDNMFVTPITVSGVSCYLYISKVKTKVDTLEFSLTNQA